jgi:DNA (cytosine-5)-methyltransferase 1
VGYDRAGFRVIGVDIVDQPRYPHEFVQGDFLALLSDLIAKYRPVGLAGSPPCQSYTPLGALHPHKTYPDLIAATRVAFQDSGLPYVIENVMTAPLNHTSSIVLCADNMGMRTVRHRRFEYGGGLTLTQPAHFPHRARTATSRRRERWAAGWHVSVTGDVGVYVGPEALGIDWMDGDGLSQAIPPAFTERIGAELMRQVRNPFAA